MSKLTMHTPDGVADNIARIAELFPHCVTETKDDKGNLKRAIDFDQLRQELSDHVVDGPRERYQLDWPGRREALLAANAPIAKTLRPCRNESVDFDATRHVFIEGDNLEALKLLQETYLNRVRLIYIDPPYNTGKEFIYDDDFAEDSPTFFRRSMQVDDAGNKLILNPESNGRFHSDWLTSICSRLRLARNLLRDDGLIFISIDDHELCTLRLVCDEIFGSDNFKGCISRVTGTPTGGGNDAIVNELDYLLVYSRTSAGRIVGLPLTPEEEAIYDKRDERGRYLTRSLRRTGGEDRREDRPSMYFAVDAPDGTPVYPIGPTGYESRWSCGEARYSELVTEGLIEWKKVDGQWQVYQRFYLEGRCKQPSNIWDEIEGNKKATRELRELFDGVKVFDHPKPVDLLKRILDVSGCEQADIVLDFYAGSATTAHATLQHNLARHSGVRFILVQLDEACDPESQAFKHGYPTIAAIGKERIRRAGKAIKEQAGLHGDKLDIGFRVLKVDTSNMKDVYYQPDAVAQATLAGQIDNVKEDRTDEDLLFQVLLDWGVDLTLPIKPEKINGKTVYFVDTNALAACFEPGINEAFIKELAQRKPLRAVFRDNGYGSDATKINVEQIFKLLSPGTEVKSI